MCLHDVANSIAPCKMNTLHYLLNGVSSVILL